MNHTISPIIGNNQPQCLVVHFIYKQYDPHAQTVNTVNVPVLDFQQSSLVDISFNSVTVKNIVKNICDDRAQTKLTKAPSNASFI